MLILTTPLTGCVPAPRTPLLTPRTRAPSVRAFAGRAIGHWPQTRWWRSFHDRSLDRLIVGGLKASGSLQAALAHARAAQATINVTRGALGPELSAAGLAERQRASLTGLIPPPFAGKSSDYGSLGITGNIDLAWWDRQHAALQAAIGRARAAWAMSAETRLVVSTDIAQDDFLLAQAVTDLRLARKAVIIHIALYRLIKARYQAGLVSALRYEALATDVDRARQREAAARLAVTRLRLALAALAGLGPRDATRIRVSTKMSTAVFAAPPRVRLDLLARRPDIRARYWQVLAAAAGIHAARAGYYPNISLDGSLAFQSIHLGNLINPANITASIGPAIHLPLFDSGARRARLSAARARYDAAVAIYNKTIVDASSQVAHALAAIRLARQRKQFADAAYASAESGLRLAVARLRAGIYGPVPAHESRLGVLAAKHDVVAARTRLLLADLALIRALGGGYHAKAKEQS